nr:hypothetical protein [Massilia sp. Dwa41.01b]
MMSVARWVAWASPLRMRRMSRPCESAPADCAARAPGWRGIRPAPVGHDQRLLGLLAHVHLAFERAVGRLQGLGAAADLGQHVIEGIDQHADLAAVVARYAQGEIAPLHYLACDVRHGFERARDRRLQARSHQRRHHQRAQHHAAEDGTVVEQAVDQPIARAQVEGADRFAVLDDGAPDFQFAVVDAVAVRLRPRGKGLLGTGLGIGGEAHAGIRVNGAGQDLRTRAQHGQLLGSGGRIVEGERRRGNAGHDVGLGAQVVDPIALEGAQIEQQHGDRGRQQCGQGREHRHLDQLATDGAAIACIHQLFPFTTRLATVSSRELSLTLFFSAESSDTSKRTRSSTILKLITLPCCRPRSHSVTGSSAPGAARRMRPVRALSLPATKSRCTGADQLAFAQRAHHEGASADLAPGDDAGQFGRHLVGADDTDRHRRALVGKGTRRKLGIAQNL